MSLPSISDLGVQGVNGWTSGRRYSGVSTQRISIVELVCSEGVFLPVISWMVRNQTTYSQRVRLHYSQREKPRPENPEHDIDVSSSPSPPRMRNIKWRVVYRIGSRKVGYLPICIQHPNISLSRFPSTGLTGRGRYDNSDPATGYHYKVPKSIITFQPGERCHLPSMIPTATSISARHIYQPRIGLHSRYTRPPRRSPARPPPRSPRPPRGSWLTRTKLPPTHGKVLFVIFIHRAPPRLSPASP